MPRVSITGIDHDRHVGIEFCGRFADARNAHALVLERAVRQVQPRDIHARMDQRHEHFYGITGRADRGHDLGLSYLGFHGYTLVRHAAREERRIQRRGIF